MIWFVFGLIIGNILGMLIMAIFAAKNRGEIDG
jgi:uncharacterized integral membrane protein